jgi:hypothetical protein
VNSRVRSAGLKNGIQALPGISVAYAIASVAAIHAANFTLDLVPLPRAPFPLVQQVRALHTSWAFWCLSSDLPA